MIPKKRIAFGCLIVAFIFTLGFKPKKGPKVYEFPDMPFFPKMPVSKQNPVTEEGVALGRYLFYEELLSKDTSISCGHCHQQKRAFSDAPIAFSRGHKLRKNLRNTPPIFNLAWYPSLFWDGRSPSIEDQVFHPLRGENELNLSWDEAVKRISDQEFYKAKFEAAFGDSFIDSNRISMAIAQFERTLLSYNSKFDKALRFELQLSADEYAGFVLMNDQSMADCLHCHSTDPMALGTNLKFSNNGLDKAESIEDFKDFGLGGFTGKEEDYGKFKIPSLRNIAFTAPYMHDGRFESLEEVLDFYSEGVQENINIDSKMTQAHRGGVRLTELEKKQIIAFLHTLSDSSFITDPKFSNPFF